MQADHVIVGAGAAGCVLVNRLSARAATRVPPIKAGGRALIGAAVRARRRKLWVARSTVR